MAALLDSAGEEAIDAGLAADLAKALPLEQKALAEDRDFYLECLNNFLLKDRRTKRDIRDGLILFWHVYVKIK